MHDKIIIFEKEILDKTLINIVFNGLSIPYKVSILKISYVKNLSFSIIIKNIISKFYHLIIKKYKFKNLEVFLVQTKTTTICYKHT